MNDKVADQKRKSFVFYLEWAECLEDLSEADQLAILRGIVEYARTGQVLQMRKELKLAMGFIIRDMQRDAEKYQEKVERLREAGRKGRAVRTNNEQQGKAETTSEQQASPTPTATTEQRKLAFWQQLTAYANEASISTLHAFFNYWTEPTPDGQRMRFELETTWSLPYRLRAWQAREPANQRTATASAAAQSAERERQYQQQLQHQMAERENRYTKRQLNAISYEDYLAMKKQQAAAACANTT